MQASFSILRRRKDFGCVHIFSDRDSVDVKDGSVDCPGYEDESYELNKVELDKAIQVIWCMLFLWFLDRDNWNMRLIANLIYWYHEYRPELLCNTQII